MQATFLVDQPEGLINCIPGGKLHQPDKNNNENAKKIKETSHSTSWTRREQQVFNKIIVLSVLYRMYQPKRDSYSDDWTVKGPKNKN